MSRECAYVAGWHARNAETNRAVTRKCAKNEEGRLITGPRLLISGSKVRVLDGPPIGSGASVTAGAPDLRLVPNWCPRFVRLGFFFGVFGLANAHFRLALTDIRLDGRIRTRISSTGETRGTNRG